MCSDFFRQNKTYKKRRAYVMEKFFLDFYEYYRNNRILQEGLVYQKLEVLRNDHLKIRGPLIYPLW